MFGNNRAAREHLRTHVEEDAQWLGNGPLAVERRYIRGLAGQLEVDGLTVAIHV